MRSSLYGSEVPNLDQKGGSAIQVQPYLLFDGRCEEAVEWVKRCPASDGDVIEIRQVFEMTDFPPDLQKAADNPTVKAQIEKRKGS